MEHVYDIDTYNQPTQTIMCNFVTKHDKQPHAKGLVRTARTLRKIIVAKESNRGKTCRKKCNKNTPPGDNSEKFHSRRGPDAGKSNRLFFRQLRSLAARSNTSREIIPVNPLPIFGVVRHFEPHVPIIVHAIFGVYGDARADSGAENAGRDGELVAQNAADDELEGVLQDFLPTHGATGLGPVARVRKAHFTDGVVRVAFDRRAFESESLVEVEDAAQKHCLSIAFETVVGISAVVVAGFGIFVGVPVTPVRGRWS